MFVNILSNKRNIRILSETGVKTNTYFQCEVCKLRKEGGKRERRYDCRGNGRKCHQNKPKGRGESQRENEVEGPLCLDPEGRGIPNASRDAFDFDLVSSILQSKRLMYKFSSG